MKKIHSSYLCPKIGNNYKLTTREEFLTLNFAEQCSHCLNQEVKSMGKEEHFLRFMDWAKRLVRF